MPTVMQASAHHLRACELCAHHRVDAAGTLLCTCPRVVVTGHHVPCESARHRHGGCCGPDANYMAWPPLAVPAAPQHSTARPPSW